MGNQASSQMMNSNTPRPLSDLACSQQSQGKRSAIETSFVSSDGQYYAKFSGVISGIVSSSDRKSKRISLHAQSGETTYFFDLPVDSIQANIFQTHPVYKALFASSLSGGTSISISTVCKPDKTNTFKAVVFIN